MSKLWNWLLVCPPRSRDVALLVLKATAIQLVWAIAVSFISNRVSSGGSRAGGPLDVHELLLALPLVVLVEETFRLVPIALVTAIAGRNRLAVLTASAVTALLFGLAHFVSNGIPLWFSICVQGVGGMWMNMIYLKVGGLHGRIGRGFLASYAVHYLYDFCLVFLVLAFSR